MQLYLGIDIGTSGTKTVLFDRLGTKLASATVEYPMAQPANGWAEQNPEDWWSAVCKTIRTVLDKSGADSHSVAGIGLSGQMHGLVMLDHENRVLRPAILWCDQRTAAECAEIEERIGRTRLIEITANPALTGFTASKILWVQKHEPELYARCAHILLPKDYIRFRLCGVYATEVSDASGMQLLDVPTRCWSEEVLHALHIDRSLLGQVYESAEITGTLSELAAAQCGLPAGIPVVGGAGDNAAAAVGEGVVCDGRAFTTIGTSGVVFAHTDTLRIDPAGRVHTFCCAVPGAWHVMGVTQAAGLSLHWLRDTVCTAESSLAEERGVDPYQLMDSLAADSPIGANRLLYLPYLMGERTPHLDPDCRGAFIGLSAMHSRADLIRAVMEGVSYSLCDCLSVLKEMDVATEDMRICGGGGKSPFWCKMLADVFGISVKKVAADEGAALGAAILAMVGTGAYPSVQAACDAIVHAEVAVTPEMDNTAQYAQFYTVYKKLYQHLKTDFSDLAKIASV